MPPRWLKFLPPILQRQLASPMAQKLVGNTGWLFADKILRAVGELTVGIWLARHLGPEQFGTLSFAIAFVALFTPLYTLGLDKIVVRNIVKNPDKKLEILGSALGLRLISSLVGTLIVGILITSLKSSEPITQVLVVTIAFGLTFQASDVITFWFQSQIQSRQDVIVRGSAYGLTSLVRAGCILAQVSLTTIGLTYSLEPCCRAIGLTIIYKRKEGFTQNWKFNSKQALDLLKQSLPLMLAGAATMIYMRIDQVMLGHLSTDKAVGIYSAAVKLSECWYFIPSVIASSFFPAIVRIKSLDSSKYYTQLQNLFRFVSATSYLAIFLLILFAKPLVFTLFGKAYAESINILIIHAFSGVFIALGLVRNLWLIAEDYSIYLCLFGVLGGVLNIVLNYFMIPNFSAIGASFATLLSYAFSFYISGFLFPSTRRIAFIMSRAILLRS